MEVVQWWVENLAEVEVSAQCSLSLPRAGHSPARGSPGGIAIILKLDIIRPCTDPGHLPQHPCRYPIWSWGLLCPKLV